MTKLDSLSTASQAAKTKTKEKFSAKRFLILIAFVFLAAIFSAGPVWYFLNQALEVQKDQIESIQNQLNNLADQLKEKQNKDVSDEIIYKNEDYNFQLTLPKTWQDYKVFETETEWGEEVGSVMTYYFALPTKDSNWPKEYDIDEGYASLFAITLLDEDQYEIVKSEDGPVPAKLGVSGNYIITWSGGQIVPEDLIDRLEEVKIIIDTISFN